MTDTHEEGSRIEVLPNHVLLQLMSSSWRTPASMRPIPLPDDDATHRAISMFDRNSTVDGHKVGVIYIAQGQTTEAEILANAYGSDDFTDLLTELGTLIKLKGAKFNTQGLDRETDGDGEFTFCWRDRVTEIVFHIPVMMPTDQERDPHCVNKKRHTGNDFVNIIFNNSGLPFRFDTFPSEFNYVNIVIAPEARSPPGSAAPPIRTELHRRFYKVQVMSKPGFPQISPAAETKVLSGKSLPAFVRLIALHASVFCLVWANREGGEHISSWRNRLREINRLRDKHSPGMQSYSNATSPGPAPSSAGGMSSRDTGAQRESVGFRRTSGPGFFGGGGGGGVDGIASQRSSIFSTATTATETDAGGFFDGESLADGYVTFLPSPLQSPTPSISSAHSIFYNPRTPLTNFLGMTFRNGHHRGCAKSVLMSWGAGSLKTSKKKIGRLSGGCFHHRGKGLICICHDDLSFSSSLFKMFDRN